MNKIAMLLTALLVAGAFALKWSNSSDAPATEAEAASSEAKRIDAYLDGYASFKAVFEKNIEALEQREISLQSAVERILAAARRDFPRYLKRLELYEPGTTDAERVAHNLMGHLRGNAELKASLCERVCALELELVQIR